MLGVAVIEFHAIFAIALLLCLLPGGAQGQIGPVQARGYLEYQFQSMSGDQAPSLQSHAAVLRTDFTTFVWRPWLVSLSGSLVVSERNSQSSVASDDSSTVRGGIRLGILPKSRFPLRVYYENFETGGSSGINRIDSNQQTYGFLQQLSSRRYGTYSLEYRNSTNDSRFVDGQTVERSSDSSRWTLNARKSFESHNLAFNSDRTQIDSASFDSMREALRHSLRHTYRGSRRFTLQNSYFFNDETLSFDSYVSTRLLNQLTSIGTWRPDTEKPLIVVGRALIQDSAFNGSQPAIGTRRTFINASANYQVFRNTYAFGTAGYSWVDSDEMGEGKTATQQAGISYGSTPISMFEGTYSYSGRVTAGNRSSWGDMETSGIQDLSADIGHSFSRRIPIGDDRELGLRLIQRVSTTHDSDGRERNALRNGAYLVSGISGDRVNHYFRVGVQDERIYGDHNQTYQLAEMYYSLEGRPARDRAWSANLSVQHGIREQTKPRDMADQTEATSYSLSVLYRYANIFDVERLNFISDLRYQSEDYRSEDPFDAVIDFERDYARSSWRNQLGYSLGLLHMRLDVDAFESSGKVSTSVTFIVRRYFGYN